MQGAPALAPGSSAAAIRRHYDLGTDFYRLFLDPSLTYSCAMFEEGDSLASAQQRKHDWHIAQVEAAGAQRVLDVGCGWGATLRRLLDQHGVAQVVGLTLSDTQRAYVEGLADPRLEVRRESWLEHQPATPYDAIISVGAFEHFARFKIAPAEKIAGYRLFFERAHALLRAGGRMSVQTIAYGDIPRGRRYRDEFIADEIFPESDLPRLADVAEACEGRFEITTVRNDRADYARTCRLWFSGLRARRADAVALVGEEVVRRYERYLRTFSYSFELGAFQLLRIVFRRIDHQRARDGRASRRRPTGVIP